MMNYPVIPTAKEEELGEGSVGYWVCDLSATSAQGVQDLSRAQATPHAVQDRMHPNTESRRCIGSVT